MSEEKCPYGAEWDSVNRQTGEPVRRLLQPEDVLDMIAQGSHVGEIAEFFDAPLKAVEHVVSLIPHMMVWRGMGRPHGPLNNAVVRAWGQPPPTMPHEEDFPPIEPYPPSLGNEQYVPQYASGNPTQYPAHAGHYDKRGGR